MGRIRTRQRPRPMEAQAHRQRTGGRGITGTTIGLVTVAEIATCERDQSGVLVQWVVGFLILHCKKNYMWDNLLLRYTGATYQREGSVQKERIILLSNQKNIELDYPWNWKRITESKSL